MTLVPAIPARSVITMAKTKPCRWRVSWPLPLEDGLTHQTRFPESGNMIIMSLSYAVKTGDLSQVTKYVRLSSLFGWRRPYIDNSFSSVSSTNGPSTSSATRSSPRNSLARTTLPGEYCDSIKNRETDDVRAVISSIRPISRSRASLALRELRLRGTD